MKVLRIDLHKDYSDAVKEAVSVLESGGVVIYPTDTLYGIGGNALDENIVRRVFEIKERPLTKPLPMIARNMNWVKELVYVNRRQEAILEKVWPGRVTAVLSKREMVPDLLTAGHKTVGVRVPDHQFLDEILKRFGYPLISTAANVSGDEPTSDINEIIDIFSQRLLKQPDLVLDVGILSKSDPSAVIDLTGSKPKILRIGPSKPEEFLKLLKI